MFLTLQTNQVVIRVLQKHRSSCFVHAFFIWNAAVSLFPSRQKTKQNKTKPT